MTFIFRFGVFAFNEHANRLQREKKIHSFDKLQTANHHDTLIEEPHRNELWVEVEKKIKMNKTFLLYSTHKISVTVFFFLCSGKVYLTKQMRKMKQACYFFPPSVGCLLVGRLVGGGSFNGAHFVEHHKFCLFCRLVRFDFDLHFCRSRSLAVCRFRFPSHCVSPSSSFVQSHTLDLREKTHRFKQKCLVSSLFNLT